MRKHHGSSLPPGVAGPQRGELQVRLEGAVSRHGPVPLGVQLHFWGELLPGPLLQTPGDCAVHPVACSLGTFARFLQDMQAVQVLVLADSRPAAVLGTASLPAEQFDLAGCSSVKLPVYGVAEQGAGVGGKQEQIASVALTLQATFSDMLTSFERDEAQAAQDHELPLYPQGGRIITPLRQPSLQRPPRGSEGTGAGTLTAHAGTPSGMRTLCQPGMQWPDGTPEATAVASGAGAPAEQGGGTGAAAAAAAAGAYGTSSGEAVGSHQAGEGAGVHGASAPHRAAGDAAQQMGNPGRVAELPPSQMQGQPSHSEAGQAADQQAVPPPSRQSLATAQHRDRRGCTADSPGLQQHVDEDSAANSHAGQSGDMSASPPGGQLDGQAQLLSPGSPAWQAEQQLRSIEVAQLSAVIAAEATAVAKYQLGVGSPPPPELLPEGRTGARRSPQKSRVGLERLKAAGRRHREPLVVQNPNMPTSPVAQQFAHQQQGRRGQQKQPPDAHYSVDASASARENGDGGAPGQPSAARPSSWQGAPGLAFQPLHPSLQLHAQGVGTGGPYSGDVSTSAWHVDAEAAAVPAAASSTSWQPERHGMLVPSAGSEHSRLPQQMLPRYMLPAELPAQHSGIGQTGLPAADAPDPQAADQALQQAPPGPAAHAEPQQHNQAVPDAEPKLAMNRQPQEEAWGVEKRQAGQGPAAGMPPPAVDLVHASAAPAGGAASHSTRGPRAALQSGMPLADGSLTQPTPQAAAVHTQAQWGGAPAPGQQPQASSMPPNITPLGVAPVSTPQLPAVTSVALVHDSAAITAAAQPASWHSSAGAPREPWGTSTEESGVSWSGHQQVTLLPSLPAAPMPHKADSDGDTLQQLIVRAERLRLMLDRAAAEQAPLDWQRHLGRHPVLASAVPFSAASPVDALLPLGLAGLGGSSLTPVQLAALHSGLSLTASLEDSTAGHGPAGSLEQLSGSTWPLLPPGPLQQPLVMATLPGLERRSAGAGAGAAAEQDGWSETSDPEAVVQSVLLSEARQSLQAVPQAEAPGEGSVGAPHPLPAVAQAASGDSAPQLETAPEPLHQSQPQLPAGQEASPPPQQLAAATDVGAAAGGASSSRHSNAGNPEAELPAAAEPGETGSGVVPHSSAAGATADSEPAAGRLQLTVLAVQPLKGLCGRAKLQLVLKALLQGQPDSTAALWTKGDSEALHGLPAMLPAAIPAQLSRPSTALAPQSTVTCILEVWQEEGVNSTLVGIVRLHLEQHKLCEALSGADNGAPMCEGHHQIWDLFSSTDVGSVLLSVCVLPPVSDTAKLGQQELQESETESESDAAADAAQAAAVLPLELPVAPLPATICVEVVRACGLLAAVDEAALWLGGGSPLLSRARQVGPHAFVELSLFPSDPVLEAAVPPLKTPFQAQTFCPEYHHCRRLQTVLDARMVRAFTTQTLCLEVWHHCPRSQAVAAALSQGSKGRPAEGPGLPRDVFLGSASAPLGTVLNRPQGLRCWLGLKSRRGEPAGAVQVAVYITQLDGHFMAGGAHSARAAFEVDPQLAALVPPDASPLSRPVLRAADQGMTGQQARATVYVQEVLLGSATGPSSSTERPRAAAYHATFRLPGSTSLERTASKPAAAAAASMHSTGQLLQSTQWRAPLDHCSVHWVSADASLVRAIQLYPLLVSVYKQESSTSSRRRSSCSGADGTAGTPAIFVGSAEIHLSSLLVDRADAQQGSSRWHSGTYIVVHPTAAHLQGTRVRLRVLLELQPSGRAFMDGNRRWDVPECNPASPPRAHATGLKDSLAAAGAAGEVVRGATDSGLTTVGVQQEAEAANLLKPQADITHPAAQQPAAQPANSHQLHPQLGRQQGEPGSSAAGTMQTAGALAIEPEARRGNFGLGTSRLGLEGMAEAQPVRGAAGMHWLGLESGVGTTTTQPVRASTGALRPEVGPDAGTAGAQPVRASAGDDWLSLESGSGRRQRIRAQISSVAAPVRASWPSAAPAPSTPAVQATEAEAGNCSPPGDAEPDWQLLRERLSQLDVMSRQMQHRLSGGLPGSTAAGSEGQPSGSLQGAQDSTDPERVSLTDSVPMTEAASGQRDDLETAAAAESGTRPAGVPGCAVDPEDSSAASAQFSAEHLRGHSPVPTAGLQVLSGTAQKAAPFRGGTSAADASVAGARGAADAVAQVPDGRPGRSGSIAAGDLLPWNGAPSTAASARKADLEVDRSAQDLEASQWGGPQAAADGLDGGGGSDEPRAAQPPALRQVTLQVASLSDDEDQGLLPCWDTRSSSSSSGAILAGVAFGGAVSDDEGGEGLIYADSADGLGHLCGNAQQQPPLPLLSEDWMFGFSKPSQTAAPGAESTHLQPPPATSALGLHAGLSTALSFSFANSLPPAQDSHEAGGSGKLAAGDRRGGDTPQEAELQQQTVANVSHALAAAAAALAAGHLRQSLLPGSLLHKEAAGATQINHQCSTEPWPVREGASAAAQEPASPARAAVMAQGGSSKEVPTCLSEAAENGLGGDLAGPASAAAGQANSPAQLSIAGEHGPLADSTLPCPEAAMLPPEPAGASSLAASAGAAAPQGRALQEAAPEAASSMHQIPGATPAEAEQQHQLPWPGRGVGEPDPQPDMQNLVAGRSNQEQAAGFTPAPRADMPGLAADAQQQAGACSLSLLEPGQGGRASAQQPLRVGRGTAEQPVVSMGQGAAGQRPEMEALTARLFSVEWAFGFAPASQQPSWQVDTAALVSVPAQVARFEAWSQQQGPAGIPAGSAALPGQPAGQPTSSPMGHPAPVAASRVPGQSSAAQSGRQAAAVEEAGQAAAVAGGGHYRPSPAAVSTTAPQEAEGGASDAAAEAAGPRQAAPGDPGSKDAAGSADGAEPAHPSRWGVAGGLGSASTAAAKAADPLQLSRDGPSMAMGSKSLGVVSHQQRQAVELLPVGAPSPAEPAAASAPQTAEKRPSGRAAASGADTSSSAGAADPGVKAVLPLLHGIEEHGATAHDGKPYLAQLRPAVSPAVEPEGHMQPQWADQPVTSQHYAVMAAAEQQAVSRQAAEVADVGVKQGPDGSEQQMPPPTSTEPPPIQSGHARQGPAGSGARALPPTARELSLVTDEGPWRQAAPRPWQHTPASSGQEHAYAAEDGPSQQVHGLQWQPAEQVPRAAAGERPRSALRLIDETLRDLDRACASGRQADSPSPPSQRPAVPALGLGVEHWLQPRGRPLPHVKRSSGFAEAAPSLPWHAQQGASRALALAPVAAGGALPRTMSADEAYQHALQLLHPRALKTGPQLRGLLPGPAERSSAQRELSATHSDAWAAPRPWLASAAGRAAQARLQLPAGQSEARAQAQGQSQWQAQPPAMRPHAGRQQSDGRFQTEQATAATSISSVGAAALPKPRRQYLDSETDRIARIMASRPKH